MNEREQDQHERLVSQTVASQLGNLMLANIELQARVAVLSSRPEQPATQPVKQDE